MGVSEAFKDALDADAVRGCLAEIKCRLVQLEARLRWLAAHHDAMEEGEMATAWIRSLTNGYRTRPEGCQTMSDTSSYASGCVGFLGRP
jgi:hypothetical protein